jgi:Alw26I/Eco31I/Esp3I family type II restriction endonuclease
MSSQKQYGNRGQEWHPDFIAYMEFIASHPNYSGMPDAFASDGKIQWEAPSNRASGRFKDTHHKRRDWWRRKADEIGVSTTADKWISRTAKLVHPTHEKPCKRCGRVMQIQYAYPREIVLARIRRLPYVEPTFRIEKLERIGSLLHRLHERCGDQLIADLPAVLRASEIRFPARLSSIDDWLKWVQSEYIPSEPSVLSPGAMSNAPDRFDGFHSFNLCCRGTADTGRHKVNLASYVTDRRVFQYWADGDWIAANRLMGLIRSQLRYERCRYGHTGPCTADHIGPISLGFVHHPEFQILCRACNSAKNNRMTMADVQHLLRMEAGGIKVISWHSKALWDLRKNSVCDDETALRLSKLLRDNRHGFTTILSQIERDGYYSFLLSLLNLDYADYVVKFGQLTVMDHVASVSAAKRQRRVTKYAIEQKARRCRVALTSLRVYSSKDNRNIFVVTTARGEAATTKALEILKGVPVEIEKLDRETAAVLSRPEVELDTGFRDLMDRLPASWPPEFPSAKALLAEAMSATAAELSENWQHDRYVRAESAFD